MMLPLAPIAAAGLVAGMFHVLSGPDHLSAVAPLVADSRGPRWKAGFMWGIGHTGGVLTVGVLALLLREVLPLDAIASWSERLVGVALIGVGAWGCTRAIAAHVHAHEHAHDGRAHTHLHVHGGTAPQAGHAPHRAPHRHTHASFAFGVLHGLAGSSHLLGVLPALALPTRSASIAYLVSYGIGNIAAMTAFASMLGAVAGTAEQRGTRVYRTLLGTCSAAAIVVGAIWLAG